MNGPRLHVLVPLTNPGVPDGVRALIRTLTDSAVGSLRAAGADARVIDVSAPVRPEIVEAVAGDGVLLLGGGDIDPGVYGGDADEPNLYGVDRRADDYSIGAVRAARERGVPVLGVCRGHQVVNVSAGGTLYPDLADPRLHHGVAPEPLFLDEPVRLAPESWAGSLYGTDRLIVRNGHHQAVREVGAGLRATAWAEDGIVEGVQATDGWCVGVQWHPEEPGGSAADAATIFGGFVAACSG